MKHAASIMGLVLTLACVPANAAGGITVKVKGTFRDDVYTSPNNGFSVRLPDLVRPGIVVNDDPAPGGVVVYFRDDFCRQYYVRDVELGDAYVSQAEVERYARGAVLPFWASAKKATLESLESVDIGRGPAVAIRQREPSGPCQVMTSDGSQMVTKAVPAEVLTYVFVADDAIYEAGVMVGEMGEAARVFTGKPKPLDEMLRAFVAGLQTRPHPQRLQKNGLREGIDAKVAGRFEGRDYLAPDGRYRVTLPPLWGLARIEEGGDPASGETMLQISDSLCRSYLVHRMHVGALSDDEMQALAEAMARTFVEQEKAANMVIGSFEMGRGEGKRLRLSYELPAQACDLGGWLDQTQYVPMDFTIYLFREGDVVYEIGYMRARISAALPYFSKREPADELLRDLIVGLRETSP